MEFEYKATNKENKIVSDTLHAKNEKEAASILKQKGLNVLYVKSLKEEIGFFGRTQIGGVSLIEKANLARHLGTMIGAGLSISESLEVISQDATNKKLKHILKNIQESAQKGESLSSAFSKYPDVFDEVFLTMTKAGEQSGTLEESFEYLGRQLVNSHDLNQKVKGALMYPAVIISAMIGVAILMATFVLPKISKAFLQLNVDLPIQTKIVLSISLFFANNYFFVFPAIGLALILLWQAAKRKTGKKLLNRFLSRLPVIKNLIKKLDLARFARTLGTLLKSGVPIIEALRVSIKPLSNPKYHALSKTFETQIEKGASLSDCLRLSKGLFPQMIIRMIHAGEKTGRLDQILFDLAEFYDGEVENDLKNLTGLLEPVLLLIIGAAVGAMVISIVAPIYSLIGNLEAAS